MTEEAETNKEVCLVEYIADRYLARRSGLMQGTDDACAAIKDHVEGLLYQALLDVVKDLELQEDEQIVEASGAILIDKCGDGLFLPQLRQDVEYEAEDRLEVSA